MAELEESLNRILSSPEEMQKIMDLAGSLMSGGGKAPDPPSSPAPDKGLFSGFSPKMLQLVSKLGAQGFQGDDKAALIQALSPYLEEKHRASLERAYEITKLLRVARAALDVWKAGQEDV